MGGNSSAYLSGSNVESAFLGSLGFMGGPSNSGLNGINSLDQQTTPNTLPSTIPTSWVKDGTHVPQNFNPITSPQFFNNETKGPFKFLGQRYYNETVNNNPSNSSSPNYLEYIIIGGAAIILVVIISKKNENQ